MPVQPEAFFLPVDPPGTGQRFCLFYPAAGSTVRGHVLYVHPFAEEMNKARRMAALQARALANAGYAVLQIDLLGCGDSSGDFGDATWQAWVDDVVSGVKWLRERASLAYTGTSQPPLWLWGLRAGCLVAAQAARPIGEPCNFLFWQPPSAGTQLLQQFLRLKVAGDMLGGQAKGVMDAMRQELAAGRPVEVAGYSLAPGLTTGLENADLSPPARGTGGERLARLEWLEVSTREDAALSPVATKTLSQWADAGYAVRSQIATGPAFWQTTEIEDAPALIEATLAAIGNPGTTP
jgi:exosortase A-associated hydrolase 2